MPRPKSDIASHHVNLYRGDMERLQALFPTVPAGRIIRELVRDCIRRMEEGDAQFIKELAVEVEL